MMTTPRCPYCGNEENLTIVKTWKFRFYEVKMFQCPKCMKTFNYYYGVSPKTGKISEFTIKLKRK